MKSYWNNSGKLQAEYNELRKLIPEEGQCGPEFPKLEILRKVGNAYYDIFNNGGCNREQDIRDIFNFRVDSFEDDLSGQINWDAIMKAADPIVTRIIRAAKREQELVSA
jgi:hypothetical protein